MPQSCYEKSWNAANNTRQLGRRLQSTGRFLLPSSDDNSNPCAKNAVFRFAELDDGWKEGRVVRWSWDFNIDGSCDNIMQKAVPLLPLRITYDNFLFTLIKNNYDFIMGVSRIVLYFFISKKLLLRNLQFLSFLQTHPVRIWMVDIRYRIFIIDLERNLSCYLKA